MYVQVTRIPNLFLDIKAATIIILCINSHDLNTNKRSFLFQLTFISWIGLDVLNGWLCLISINSISWQLVVFFILFVNITGCFLCFFVVNITGWFLYFFCKYNWLFFIFFVNNEIKNYFHLFWYIFLFCWVMKYLK